MQRLKDVPATGDQTECMGEPVDMDEIFQRLKGKEYSKCGSVDSASRKRVCLHLYPVLRAPSAQISFCGRDFQFTFGLEE